MREIKEFLISPSRPSSGAPVRDPKDKTVSFVREREMTPDGLPARGSGVEIRHIPGAPGHTANRPSTQKFHRQDRKDRK
jgi:hypothetical protein